MAVAPGAVTRTGVAVEAALSETATTLLAEADDAALADAAANGFNESNTPSGSVVNSTTYALRATCAAEDSEGVKSASLSPVDIDDADRRCLKNPLAGR